MTNFSGMSFVSRELMASTLFKQLARRDRSNTSKYPRVTQNELYNNSVSDNPLFQDPNSYTPMHMPQVLSKVAAYLPKHNAISLASVNTATRAAVTKAVRLTSFRDDLRLHYGLWVQKTVYGTIFYLQDPRIRIQSNQFVPEFFYTWPSISRSSGGWMFDMSIEDSLSIANIFDMSNGDLKKVVKLLEEIIEWKGPYIASKNAVQIQNQTRAGAADRLSYAMEREHNHQIQMMKLHPKEAAKLKNQNQVNTYGTKYAMKQVTEVQEMAKLWKKRVLSLIDLNLEMQNGGGKKKKPKKTASIRKTRKTRVNLKTAH